MTHLDRTAQSSALLYYAFDQFYNFLQVSLLQETQVALTLNNGNAVHSCIVHKDVGGHSYLSSALHKSGLLTVRTFRVQRHGLVPGVGPALGGHDRVARG